MDSRFVTQLPYHPSFQHRKKKANPERDIIDSGKKRVIWITKFWRSTKCQLTDGLMGRRWLEWPSHLPTGFLWLFLALWPSSYCTSSAKIHPPIHPPDGRVSRVVGKNSVWPHAEWERGKRGSNIELGINPRWQKCASLAAWDSVFLDSALRKWVMHETRSQFDGVVPPLRICPCRWKRRNEVALFLHLIQKIDP
jgi:hypothetical protein